MDTTFWGPSGHKLLHMIAYCYSFDNDNINISGNKIISFFNSLKYVLPCIYCRRSYSKYIKEIPIKEYNNKSNKTIFKWIYIIHNKINDKLRKQGYITDKNPNYKDVIKKYENIKLKGYEILGWNFLYSVVFDYPQYSFEISKARYEGYINFFTNLKYLFPCKRIRNIYNKYIDKYPVENYMKTRDDFKKWLYRFERKIKRNCCTFSKRCNKVKKYQVNKCKGDSCRL